MVPELGHGQKSETRLKRQAVALLETGGSHGKVYRSDKQKKDGAYTRYIHIFNDKKDPPFVADYSAITSELLRFVSTDVFPKVRVITRENPKTGQRESVGYLSAEIKGYQTAYDLIDEEPAKFNNLFTDAEKKQQLAALFVGAYFSAENDLHAGNWGVDAHGNIKKIDNDQALFFHTAGYKRQAGFRKDEAVFTGYPNLLFSREKAFELTAHDIERLPLLDFAKPTNWPSDEIGILRHLKTLSKDPEFKKYKWQYFTKLLLVQDRQLQDICTSHTLDITKGSAVYKELQSRQVKLRTVLLQCPEYRDFLFSLRDNPNNKAFIQSELVKYDSQFIAKTTVRDSRTGDVIQEKDKYKHKYSERLFCKDANVLALYQQTLDSLLASAQQITVRQYYTARHEESQSALKNHCDAYSHLVGANIGKDTSADILESFQHDPKSKTVKEQVIKHFESHYQATLNYDRYGYKRTKLERNELLEQMWQRYQALARDITSVENEARYYNLQLRRLSLQDEIAAECKSFPEVREERQEQKKVRDARDTSIRKRDKVKKKVSDIIGGFTGVISKVTGRSESKPKSLKEQLAQNEAEIKRLGDLLNITELKIGTWPASQPVQSGQSGKVQARLFRPASEAPSGLADALDSTRVQSEVINVTKPKEHEKPEPGPAGVRPKGRS